MSKVADPAMTVCEVARYLNVVERTIYRLVQKGELPGFKVAGVWRFRREDIEYWIENRKQNQMQLLVKKKPSRKRNS